MTQLSGRVLVARTATPALSGTVDIPAEPAASFGGTVSISRAMQIACSGRTRHVRVLVYIGVNGAWTLLDGLTGRVEWGQTLDVVSDWARFTVADQRACRWHASSLAAGGVPVRIDLRVRTNEADSTQTVFVGRTLSGSNADALRPKATFRCEGLAAAWGKRGRHASVSRGARSGYRRGDALKAWAAAAGLPTVGMVIPDGGRCVKAIDLVSETGQSLLERFALVEGWHFRPRTDGTIEILDRDYVNGAARFAFTPTTYDSLGETLPDRPITYWTLTGTQIDESRLGQRSTVTANASTPAGSASVSVTYEGDVEVYRTWTEGIGRGQLQERKHEVFTEWNRTADNLPTGQMKSRRHLVWGWVNPECAVALGTLCWDGKYHLTQSWSWRIVQEIVETLTWGDCTIERKTTTTKRYYASLGFRSNPPANCLRQDGTYRSVDAGQTEDALIEVGKEIADYKTDGSETAKRVEIWGWVPDGYESAVGPPPADTAKERYWIANVLVGAAAASHAGVRAANGGALSSSSAGAQVPRANGTEPQHKTDPIQLTYEISGSGFPYAEGSATVAEAQSVPELQVAAEMIAESQLGTRYPLDHAGLVWLQVGDPVTVTGISSRDAATGTVTAVRNLAARAGYVESMDLSVDTASGAFDGKTTVLVPWRAQR